MIDEKLLEWAIKKWGKGAQILMALEESGEFIAAVTQHLRGRDSNVIEEIADCLIMMHQMRYIFGAEAVDTVIRQKMTRLRIRLGDGDINSEPDAKRNEA